MYIYIYIFLFSLDPRAVQMNVRSSKIERNHTHTRGIIMGGQTTLESLLVNRDAFQKLINRRVERLIFRKRLKSTIFFKYVKRVSRVEFIRHLEAVCFTSYVDLNPEINHSSSVDLTI